MAPTPASLAFREPAAPPLSLPRTGHPTTSPYGVIPPYLMARPESSPSGSVSGFCGPNRLPALRFMNAPPYHRRYLIRVVPPSSPADVFNSAPQTELQQLGFGFFDLSASWLAFRERVAPSLPLPCTRRPTISPHRPPPLFSTAHPKPSSSSSVSGFLPQPPPWLAFRERAAPPPPLPCTHCPTISPTSVWTRGVATAKFLIPVLKISF